MAHANETAIKIGDQIMTPKQLAKDLESSRKATGFQGSRRAPLSKAEYQPLRNADAVVGERAYGGHALDQMQNRGVTPSVVENAIEHGVPSPDPILGRTRFYDSTNNITVITEGDRVVTVIPGRR